MLNPDTRIRTANKAFFSMFNTDVDRTEGHYFFEVENGLWNLPELKQKLQEISLHGKTFENIEVTKVFPGLGEKTLVFNALRMDKEGDNRYRILLVIQDATSVFKTQKELKEREEWFRLMLENAFDIMMIYSKEGSITYQSETLERTLGYPVDETLNKNVFDLNIVHLDDKEINKNLFEQAVKSAGKNVKGQLRLRHKNGGYRVMDVVLRNLLENQSIKGIIANYQDVTDNVSK